VPARTRSERIAEGERFDGDGVVINDSADDTPDWGEELDADIGGIYKTERGVNGATERGMVWEFPISLNTSAA
jgi:hypothetical protein